MSEVVITRSAADRMIAHCLEAYPLEGCGLLAATPELGEMSECYPTRNAAESSRVYTIDPRDHLRADRDAEEKGLEIVGVFHSHTHTQAYPSPTDIDQAPVPSWHYILVSFQHKTPVIRSYSIIDGRVEEEHIAIR